MGWITSLTDNSFVRLGIIIVAVFAIIWVLRWLVGEVEG